MKCVRQKYKHIFFNCNLRWDNQNLTSFPLLNERSCAPKFFCPLAMFNFFLLSCRHCWKFICFGGNCSSISKCCDTSIHCPAEVANLFVRVAHSSHSSQTLPLFTVATDTHGLKGSTLSGLSGGYPASYKRVVLTHSCLNNKICKQYYLFFCSKHTWSGRQ